MPLIPDSGGTLSVDQELTLRQAAIQAGRLVTFENGDEMIPQDFKLGWEAGRQSNMAKFQDFSQMFSKNVLSLCAERARSAKLIERLRKIRTIDSWSKIWAIIADVINEYECNRD